MNKVLNIMNVLSKIEYGFKDLSGINLIKTDKWDKFYEFYYLLPPEELLKKECGVCWDQVELERKLFLENNINCDTYFIYIDDMKNLPSHTFLTFKQNNKHYWFEHSWYSQKGIFEYSSIKELILDVKDKFVESIKEENLNAPNLNIFIYKYNKPKYYSTCNQIYDYIKTQKLIYKKIDGNETFNI